MQGKVINSEKNSLVSLLRNFLFNIILFIYLFLAVLGLHCCAWAFSSGGKQGLFSSCGVWASHCSSFSCCRVWALGSLGSVAVAHGFNCPKACGIVPDKGQTHVSRINRQILNCWTTKGILLLNSLTKIKMNSVVSDSKKSESKLLH